MILMRSNKSLSRGLPHTRQRISVILRRIHCLQTFPVLLCLPFCYHIRFLCHDIELLLVGEVTMSSLRSMLIGDWRLDVGGG